MLVSAFAHSRIAVASDHFIVDPYLAPHPFRLSTDSSGRIRVHPTVVSGERTAVIIVAGQSNAGCHDDSTHIPTRASEVQNFNIFDGGLYHWDNPVLGCTSGTGSGNDGSSWMGRLGDEIIASGWFGRVIFVPIAVLGTSCADWARGNHKSRIKVAAGRLNAVAYLIAFPLFSGSRVKPIRRLVRLRPRMLQV